MKFWYHLIAAIVGFSAAALIVFLVFGNASEEGARPSGSAPGSVEAADTMLCGTVTPAESTSAATRKLASENMPALTNRGESIAAIRDDQVDQKAWIARVHAASGLCADEIDFPDRGIVEISMSTVPGVSEADATALAAGALAQAFTPPFNPAKVTLLASVDGTERTAVVSRRAWNAYTVRRRQVGVPLTMKTLTQFRTAVYQQPDLRVTGWG